MMQRLLRTAVLFIFGLSMPVVLTQAVEVNPAFRNCSGQYLEYITTQQSSGVKRQGIQDVFKLNSCQQSDLQKVNQSLEQVRDDLKSSFKVCEDTTELKLQYQKLLLETYVIRNLVKRGTDYPSEEDAEALRAVKAKLFDDLRSDMQQRFVVEEKRVTQKQFENYFQEWEEKYSERIDAYSNCKEGAWAELTETWNGFKENIDKISKAFSDDMAATEAELAEEPEAKPPVKTTDLNGFGIFKGEKQKLQQSIVTEEKTISDVTREGYLDIDSVVNALEASRIDQAVELAHADRLARYTVLYGFQSGPNTHEKSEIIAQMNLTLEVMTTVDLPQIKEIAGQVYDKQCQ